MEVKGWKGEEEVGKMGVPDIPTNTAQLVYTCMRINIELENECVCVCV